MSGSSIFRDVAARRVHSGLAGCVLAAVLLAAPAYALDPGRTLSQYERERWGIERGFPGGPVYSITETGDGYLWIAAEKGLVRFDGVAFRLVDPPPAAAGAGPTVLGLNSDPDGGLWARFQGPALLRYRNGTWEDPLGAAGIRQSIVTAMLRRNDRSLLTISLGHGAVVYRDGTFSTLAGTETTPRSFVIAVAETANGDIWLGTRDAGLFRLRSSDITGVTRGLPDLKINCLLPVAGGELWIGTDRGVARWTGSAITRAGLPPALDGVPVLAMLHDRDGNTWIAAGARGLLRVNASGAAWLDPADHPREAVSTLFEDRDGNIWLGTSRGIERLREAAFSTYTASQGLPSEAGGPVYVDSVQRTWFSPGTGGLYWLRDGRVRKVDLDGLGTDVIYSIAGRGDEVWVGRQRGGLTRLRPQGDTFSAEHFTQADGLPQNSVYVVLAARDGAIWTGTLSGGASRLKDRVFTTYDTGSGLASNTVASMLESADGTMWFATPNGVSTWSRGRWHRFTIADGLPSNDVNTMFEDSTGAVWAGTASGLALFERGRPRALAAAPGELRGAVLGLAEDRAGQLWVATADRVLRAGRAALAAGTLADADLRQYDIRDGLLAIEGVKRHRSVVSGPDGRIWFALRRGLSVVDPSRVDGRIRPALTHVEEVQADGRRLDLRGALRIPSTRRRVTFAYAGLSLSVPERVMFRYRLDGFDADWSAPVPDRQTVYTNLKPGPYLFRVTASNSDGLWNGAEATLGFDVAPTFWETPWFSFSVVLLVAGAGWAVYWLRLRQVARQLNVRFEARLAERTRIAQELHDTLLQGFVSASMQLHVAVDRLPEDSPARPSVAKVLDLMRRVIDEGRNAVRGLRASGTVAQDLAGAFSGVREELGFTDDQTTFRVIIDGRPRPMHPLIRDEVYRIGREAVVNAFRHAEARSIEVEVEYLRRELRIRVRDDGRGIDPGVVTAGRSGHWGLPGMRERAELIGARFKVSTRSGAGTEVELSVPGRVAFEDADRSAHWWSRMVRRRVDAER